MANSEIMKKLLIISVLLLTSYVSMSQSFITKKVPTEFVKIKLDSVFVTDTSNLFTLIQDSVYPSASANQLILYNGSSWVADNKVAFETGNFVTFSDTTDFLHVGRGSSGQAAQFRVKSVEKPYAELSADPSIQGGSGDVFILDGDCSSAELDFAEMIIANGYYRNIKIIGGSTITNGCTLTPGVTGTTRVIADGTKTLGQGDVLELDCYAKKTGGNDSLIINLSHFQDN